MKTALQSTLALCSLLLVTLLTSGCGSSSNDHSVSDSPNQNPPSSNRIPLPVADSARSPAGKILKIDVLGNDSDPDGDPISLQDASITQGTGKVSISDGLLQFEPDGKSVGQVIIVYTISDGTAVAQAEVTIELFLPRTSLRVSWQPPQLRENGENLYPENDIARYVVAYKHEQDNNFKLLYTTDNTPEILINGVTSGRYQIKVATQDTQGLNSVFSAPLELDVPR
ncbi:Ig-like domain-containing protein [Gynuella sp.]|uniref:Ig-like domain-containing protein n=1 Tax=Gynuella sp. TaxID=2969146 RepID=UPI003D09D50C